MLFLTLQIISTLILITYYSINIYISVRQDAVNQRVVRYAWFHVRDKWKARIDSGYNSVVRRIRSAPAGLLIRNIIYGMDTYTVVPTKRLRMSEFEAVSPDVEIEEIIRVDDKDIIAF